MFRGSESLTMLLLEWVSKTELEMQAMELMLASVGELMKDLALEEMEECLQGFMEDVGPLIIMMERNQSLQQLVEGQITALFEEITQPKPKICLHKALSLIASQGSPCSLAFDKFLKHIFCEKVATNIINEMPTMI